MQVKRNRKCSIVREEEDDEEELSDGVVHSDSSSTFSRRGSKSEGRLNLLMQKVVLKNEDEGKMFKNGVCPLSLTCKDDTKIVTHTTKSLDEIEISQEVPAPAVKTRNLPTIRRNKLIQIRTPSCSSSEASDDDTNKARKKKSGNINDCPTRYHYRDSHDDSSDSQEQPNHFAISTAVRISKRQHQQQSHQSSSGNDSKQQNNSSGGGGGKEKSNTRNKKHDNLRQMRSRVRRHTTSRHKESQSLDRICESHEYGAGNEFNHTNNTSGTGGNKRNSISGTCATIDVDEINPKFKSAQSDTNITNLLNSAIIEDELLYGGVHDQDGDDQEDGNGKAKAIIGTHTTKYSRAFKKITQLKRYFHVVNFS